MYEEFLSRVSILGEFTSLRSFHLLKHYIDVCAFARIKAIKFDFISECQEVLPLCI